MFVVYLKVVRLFLVVRVLNGGCCMQQIKIKQVIASAVKGLLEDLRFNFLWGVLQCGWWGAVKGSLFWVII